MDLQELEREGGEGAELTQDREKWRVVVDAVTNNQVP
jgi:hypothetical protein